MLWLPAGHHASSQEYDWFQGGGGTRALSLRGTGFVNLLGSQREGLRGKGVGGCVCE